MKKIYVCKICGNTIDMIDDSGVIPHCCNTQMTEEELHTEDQGKEKHVPVVEAKSVKVEGMDCPMQMLCIKVGSEPHPMTAEHQVEWIIVESTKGDYRIRLEPFSKPEVKLLLPESEKVIAVYEYCNIHGLWVKHLTCQK